MICYWMGCTDNQAALMQSDELLSRSDMLLDGLHW